MNNILSSFVLAFGFTTSDKIEKIGKKTYHLNLNLIKASAYIPILGTISQIVTGIFFLKDNSVPKKIGMAFFTRAALSTLAPLTLPIIDIAGSILYAVNKKRNDGLNPLFK